MTSTSARSRRRSQSGRRPARMPAAIPRYVAEALHRARSGCPGAVYLELDSHAVYGNAAPLDIVPAGFPVAPTRAAGDPADIGAAVAALAAAERPIIVAGSGAFWSGAGVEIGRFAEMAQIPVITASAARGVVADSHPWSLGSLVHGGLAIPSADCVLVLGSAFNANVMYGGAAALRVRSDHRAGGHRSRARRWQPSTRRDGDRRHRLGGS